MEKKIFGVDWDLRGRRVAFLALVLLAFVGSANVAAWLATGRRVNLAVALINLPVATWWFWWWRKAR